MMWYGNDPGWGGWLLMSLGMLAFWALVAVAVIALVRAQRVDSPHDSGRTADPRTLLDERFARGEIDAEEYQQRRELLNSGR